MPAGLQPPSLAGAAPTQPPPAAAATTAGVKQEAGWGAEREAEGDAVRTKRQRLGEGEGESLGVRGCLLPVASFVIPGIPNIFQGEAADRRARGEAGGGGHFVGWRQGAGSTTLGGDRGGGPLYGVGQGLGGLVE